MQPQSDGVERMSGLKLKRYLKLAALCALGGLIFVLGVGTGRGDISFASSASSSNKQLPADLNYASVEQVYDLLKTNYDGKLDTAKLLDGIKAGLTKAAGDPYTLYFNTKEAEDFTNELNGSFTGIGAELGEDENSNLIIVSPIEGFPAAKAGLRPQDVITSIDGTSTNGMTIDEAVNRIRGKKDTKVTLRILRNKTEDLSITIVRDEIKIPSVKWELLDGKVGYIRISQFGDDTDSLMDKAAAELKDKGATSIVLDLRGNPGGLLSSAVKVSSMWLPKGKTVLQEKRGGVVVQTYTADGSAVFEGMPTAVLINAGSASASEIVSGALRDNKVATLFGEKSYGKGSVQELQKLPNGAELKVTVARWYRPNGQNIDKKGIKPDEEVKMTDDDYKQKRDPQKDAALDFVKQ
jgi:carboxyl-terminal processing protease